MDIQKTRITTNGIELDVHQAGPETGELLIFLHGFPEHALAWRQQITFFAEQGYRVWAPDQRGYADSDKPKAVSAYSLNQLAKDITGLIDAAGEEQAIVIGHDWGAAVTWWLGCNHPERLRSIVVLNVPHPHAHLALMKKSFKQVRKSWYMFLFQLPWIPEALFRKNNFELMRSSVQGTALKGTFSDAQMQEYIEYWDKPGVLTSIINWYRAAFREQPKPRLASVPVPVTIIWGRKDSFLDEELAEMSREYADKLENLHYLDEATHWLAHEKPDEVNQLILNAVQSAPSVGK